MSVLTKFRLFGSKDKKKRKSRGNGLSDFPGRYVLGYKKDPEKKEKIKITDPKTGAIYYEYQTPKKDKEERISDSKVKVTDPKTGIVYYLYKPTRKIELNLKDL